ncbi:MAG: class I SAM-dependent methyltransferase [Deltaproteobacteria bacterium]|nr:class I SAM-dependent methyltransferase [Deltaproteobacteria bacterium]
MDVDWTLINRAKNLVEDQIDKPILKIPIIADYREPLAKFLRPGMSVLDIGANNGSLEKYLRETAAAGFVYKSMDVDRSNHHDYYSLDEITERFDAIGCFEVVEQMPPGMALEFFRHAYDLLNSGGQIFVSTPNVYHPMSFRSDSSHVTPFRIRHLAGWLATAGFTRFYGYRVCRMDWKKRWRSWRYRGVLRLLNIDFAPGIIVVAQK